MERRGTQTLGGIAATVLKRWLVVVVTALIGASVAYWVGGSIAASYSATSVAQVFSEGRPADMSTEQLIAGSDSVADNAVSTLRFPITASELQDATTVGNPQGSFLLTFEVRLGDPQEAALAANAFANAYLESRAELLRETTGSEAEDVIPGFLVDPADAPSAPSGVSQGLYAVGGLALGLLLGIVLALIVDRADPRIRSARRMQTLFYDDIYVTTDDPVDEAAMLAVLAHRVAPDSVAPSLALLGADAELISRLQPHFRYSIPAPVPTTDGEAGIQAVNAAFQPRESLQIATAAESDLSVIVATGSDSRKQVLSLYDNTLKVTGKPCVGWFIRTTPKRRIMRRVEPKGTKQGQPQTRKAKATPARQGAVR